MNNERMIIDGICEYLIFIKNEANKQLKKDPENEEVIAELKQVNATINQIKFLKKVYKYNEKIKEIQ